VTKKIINIGAQENDRSGDLIRTAFDKINQNFTELYSGLPMLSVGSVPPTGPHTVGEQWWDSTDGNSYIWYDGAWVPSTASVSDQTKNVRTNTGNSINIDFQADGVITTTQTTDINIAFSNYTVGSRVKVVVATSSTSLRVNLGVLATKSSNGTTVAQATVVPSTIMLEYVCTTTQASGVFVTVSTTGSSSSFSGSYADLTNKPALFDGAYASLTGKPTIPAAQIQSDWTQASNVALDFIKNKPALFSGSYTDLTNKPTIPSAYTLPTASASILGGIKIGTGLSIDGSGVVTASAGSVSSLVNGTKTVSLGSDGNLTFADAGGTFFGNGYLRSGTSGINVGIKSWDSRQKVFVNDTNVTIQTVDNSSQAYDWVFDKDGRLTLPAGGVISEGGGLTGAIKLTPAGGANANQALLIYPTAAADGDHVHLTAGGGATELYLGNDLQYVKLVDGGNVQVQASTANFSAHAAWTFGTDGILKLPNNSELRQSTPTYDAALAGWEFIRGGEIASRIANGQALVQYYPMVNWYPTGTTAQGYIDFLLNAWTIQNTDGATLIIQPAMSSAFYVQLRAALIAIRDTYSVNATTKSVSISSAYGKSWNFDYAGALTLPDASVIASYKPVTVIAQSTSTRTIANNASAAFIPFVDTVDTANSYSADTFTVPYTGYYQVNLSIYFSTSVTLSSGSLFIDTNLDNAKVVTIFNGAWSGSYLHYSTVIPATTGDSVRIAIRQVSGASIDLASGCRLTIHRVSIS
jgi:hypothetical protein